MSDYLNIFNSNFSTYHQRCTQFAMSFIYDSGAAEDIASEALMELWKRLSKGEKIDPQLPFLFGIVRNKALHYLRHQQVIMQYRSEARAGAVADLELRMTNLEACDPNVLFSNEVMGILNESLDKLAPSAKEVFCLSRYQGLSNKEIAQKMGIAEKTVEYHMTQALKFLRLKLKDYLPLISIFLGL